MSDTASLAQAFLAQPYGDTISAEEVVETLSFFDSWEDRYRYVIDLGKGLSEMPESLKTEQNFVHGCQSQVWIDCHKASDGRVYFLVDADAHVVRGLAAIVLAAYNAKTPAQIRAVDIDDYFQRLDLIRHISATRGNGLQAMVGKIQATADQLG